MNEDYEPSPAARLIEHRRVARGISVRRAARDADLSEGRWRQIAKGYQQAAKGVKVPVNAPAETLARMAKGVEIQADEMAAVGANEVAEMLRSLSISKLRHPMHGTEGGTSVSLLSDQILAEELVRRLEAGAAARRQLSDLRLGMARNQTSGEEGGSGGDTASSSGAEGTSARKDQSLTRPDQGVVPENFDLAAYAMPPGGSMKQRLDRAQDEAGEAPDPEGPEHGA